MIASNFGRNRCQLRTKLQIVTKHPPNDKQLVLEAAFSVYFYIINDDCRDGEPQSKIDAPRYVKHEKTMTSA